MSGRPRTPPNVYKITIGMIPSRVISREKMGLGNWFGLRHTVPEAPQFAVQRERQIKRMKSARWIRAHLLNPDATAVNPDESGL